MEFTELCTNSIPGIPIPLFVIRYILRKNFVYVIPEMSCFHWFPDFRSFVE